MLSGKKISYIILGFLILFSAGIIFWAFRVLDGFSFKPPFFAPRESSYKLLIKNNIENGKEFLYRMEDSDFHGFHKYYYASEDRLEDQLHTVYSASIIYTFLYIYDYNKDEKILTHLDDWLGFLLSMQETDKDSPRHGAFSYSFNITKKEIEKNYIVGTSALSIFTLLKSYEIAGEKRYLDSAKIAGDWIVSMQRQDGVVRPYVEYKDNEWVYGNKESFLYNGQCLSALSKLYLATKDQKYYLAAEKIAKRFSQKYEQAGEAYVVDEYRAKNPISNTWLVMSLMDFYKASGENYYKDIVFKLSSQIVSTQFADEKDSFNYGRIDGAYSTSGNGFISETITDVYSLCLGQKKQDCEEYKTAALGIMHWIMQYAYSEKNSSLLPNPSMALGGIYWNDGFKYVRIDSVCHALNGYARMMRYL